MQELKLITIEDLQAFKQEVLDAIHEEMSGSKSSNPCDYLSAEEVKKILGISSKQFQIIRNRRYITHYVIGRKIYVKRCDLDTYMEEYKIKSST